MSETCPQVLRDDPVRLLRALRFRATLRFELHDSFWLAAPLAVPRCTHDLLFSVCCLGRAAYSFSSFKKLK